MPKTKDELFTEAVRILGVLDDQMFTEAPNQMWAACIEQRLVGEAREVLREFRENYRPKTE